MKNVQGMLHATGIGHSAILGLAMVLLTTAVAFGARKSPAKETALLAEQITANMTYGSRGKVSAFADGCRLQINFESFEASFDLQLKDTTVAESETEGGIVIRNTHMTRKIRNRAPEPFDRLSVKVNRTNVKSVMKTFENAIAACASERVIASNDLR